MTLQARLGYWFRVLGLPLGLVLLVTVVLGSHYETNDDFCLTLLLRGRTAAAPVTHLHLYFHGWAGLLAGLYQLGPAVPWYGLTLYALLTLALVLLTAVLDQLLAPHTRSWPRAGLLAAFLLLAGTEHAQWFNYVRVPLLLSGALVLWAAQQAHSRRWVLPLSLLLFAAAWAIRPSAAWLGLLAVAPAAWWLGGQRVWRVPVALAGLALLLGGLLALTRTPEAAQYRRLDVLKSEVLDYGWLQPAPRTAADSLGVQAVQQWAFGDSTLVNEALFARAYQLRPRVLQCRLADQLLALPIQLVRDYFPLLVLNVLLLLLTLAAPAPQRRGAWAYLLSFGLLLLALQLGLKLPPRLAGPLLTLLTVAHAAVALRQPLIWPGWFRRYALPALLLTVAGLYAYKVAHRRRYLAYEEASHRQVLRELARHQAGPLVGIGVERWFKSLSPFRQYVPAAGPPWLLITGWATLDPSQPRLRQQLTGIRNQAAVLQRLRRQPGVVLIDAYAVHPAQQPHGLARWEQQRARRFWARYLAPWHSRP